MDSATCNVIYVDRNVRCDTQLANSSTAEDIGTALGDSGELRTNVQLILYAFGNAHVCSTGAACISTIFELHDTAMIELKPTIVLIDVPHDEQRLASNSSRDPSPYSQGSDRASPEECVDDDAYGLRLLDRIVYETHSRNLSKLVVPIPVVTFPLLQSPPPEDDESSQKASEQYTDPEDLDQSPDTARLPSNHSILRTCLDSGAVDIMASPLHAKTMTTLEVHAYRAHKEAVREQQAQLEITRGRKRSWVGVHDDKAPFSYLREAMVSSLMTGICKSGDEDIPGIGNVRVCVSADSRAEIAQAIGRWHFCAHDFSDDQLLVAASLMFKHAFSMPELEQWRLPTDQLTTFLVACRAAYNTFVPYHNFRHAVDVLQATFNFLVHIGALPPYPLQSGADVTPTPKSPLAALLKPFEALTLLISAIGHDVGHPGVNNGFLVVLNAPLAQLYNDRSVLESFHCAAYSQILRRYWPLAFENTKMRSLMISSILATDMGLHFDYMTKLGNLQERFQENHSTDGWNGRTLESETALLCALIIKCADISNVARKYDTALKWMYILCDEFSRQASMENQIGISSSLISEPRKDFLSLAKAQLGFMNMFAIPLFQGVADLLPFMQYTVDELEGNKTLFETAIEDLPEMEEDRKKRLQGTLSPRSMSIAIAPQDSRDSSSGKTLGPVQHTKDHQSAMKGSGSSLGGYREINGVSNEFESAGDFGGCDRFSLNDAEHHVGRRGKQRCSETTEGSNSVPYSAGDWASQATSATTGKMPLSPSTQGTSIISQESLERPSDVQAANMASSDGNHLVPPVPSREVMTSEEDLSNGARDDKSLKKRPSRFRMNALNLFRRHKGSSSPSRGESGAAG
ncbi:3' 5'-cyclic-nucleotide phosphodiesterase 2 [Apiospora marii]|uniref:Phosphodiesterase n=1 Tax=Apiospora marii TaxID=335849 RepID=A0ABR1SEW2_9PEZI